MAIVVSLLYLARQISQNTQAMRRTAAHEAVDGMLSWFGHALAGSDLWAGWSEMFQQYLGAPGSQEYWRRRRLLFSKWFQEWVNGFETDRSICGLRRLRGPK